MNTNFRSDVNFLRMVAVMSVLINHISPTKLAGGYLGVDIFFVISAYIISSLLLKEYSTNGGIKLFSFYKMRIFRIAPTLVIPLIFTIVLSSVFANYYNKLQSFNYSQNLGTVDFTSFCKFFQSGYLIALSDINPFFHLWSFKIGSLFYFLFPISLILLWRFKNLYIYLLSLAFVASLILASVLDNYHFVYYNSLTRAFELIAGVLASIYVHNRSNDKQDKNNTLEYQNLIISILSLAIIVFSLFYLGKKYRLPNQYSLMVVLPTVALLIVGVSNGHHLLQKFYKIKVFQLLGLWSYSIYLWHWVLLALAKMIFGLNLDPHVNYIILFGSIGIGALSYYFIEQKTRYLNWSLKKGFMIFILLPLFFIMASYYYAKSIAQTMDVYEFKTAWTWMDRTHQFFILYPEFAYVNVVITIIFYAITIAYLIHKSNIKCLHKFQNFSFYSNLGKLSLLCSSIAWGWRFIAPEFIDSTPIRVLMHYRYFATFIYDTVSLLAIFMLILQIPKFGRYLFYIAVLFVFVYSLTGFVTFFHIKRLPSSKDFELGSQILLISPLSYVFLAIKSKLILFILSYVMPLVITILCLIKIDLNSLKIKPLFSFKMALLTAMMPVFLLGLFVLEVLIKDNPDSFKSDMFLSESINRLGIFKYSLYALESDKILETDYNSDLLKQQVDKLLKEYPSDKLESSSSMPQIILGWASESFMFPERLDPTLKNQDQINPNFKKLLSDGVANSISSSFPLLGTGTVYGEATLLTSVMLDLPKQSHPSLVTYYKSLGYTTIYMHVVADTFYKYQERSKFYGFDEIYLGSHFKVAWGNDRALFSLIKKRIQKAIDSNEKIFISFVDIGRHGPHEFHGNDKESLISQLSETYGAKNDISMLNYIYKSNISDGYLGDLIDFISSKEASIALMLNADHVPGGFGKEYPLVGDEANYMSEFLFYHNHKNLIMPSGYSYIHQSLVPSLFLKSLGMPLRSLDKYILEESKNEKTYQLDTIKKLSYDITLGQQTSTPLFVLIE